MRTPNATTNTFDKTSIPHNTTSMNNQTRINASKDVCSKVRCIIKKLVFTNTNDILQTLLNPLAAPFVPTLNPLAALFIPSPQLGNAHHVAPTKYTTPTTNHISQDIQAMSEEEFIAAEAKYNEDAKNYLLHGGKRPITYWTEGFDSFENFKKSGKTVMETSRWAPGG